jgi:DNA ligase 1
MSAIFKVMKGEPVALEHLRYPLLALPKLNGVRGHVRSNTVLSTSNTPLPNIHLQAKYRHLNFHDGELLVGDPTDSKNSLNRTTSIVMSDEKPLDGLNFYVFDHTENLDVGYAKRYKLLTPKPKLGVIVVNTKTIRCQAELLETEQEWVGLGYEGLMTRDPEAHYKCGKSTAKQAWMGKMKRFSDAEAEIIGFAEGFHNTNEATVSNTGRTKRSSAKAGKVAKGTLGSVIVRREDGVVFGIGTGFSDAEKDHIWANRPKYLGKLAKYKFFEIGSGNVPVLPVWQGLRDRRDM